MRPPCRLLPDGTPNHDSRSTQHFRKFVLCARRHPSHRCCCSSDGAEHQTEGNKFRITSLQGSPQSHTCGREKRLGTTLTTIADGQLGSLGTHLRASGLGPWPSVDPKKSPRLRREDKDAPAERRPFRNRVCGGFARYSTIADAVADSLLHKLLEEFMAEVRPTLRRLPGIDLDSYAGSI